MVSVIIPIYNGTKYIERLMSQMLQQTYKSLEVVFVDDGSTDHSYQMIMDKISEVRDDGILFRLVSQENTGQGGARNRGLAEAKGDYLLFMDQDDYIKEDYIERLLSVAEKSGADIVISGYEHVTVNRDVREHVELINNEWCRFMNITPWGKIYRRDFVEKNNIRFLPVPLGEDIYFNVLCYSHASRVEFTDYVGYQWVINESSVSNTVHRAVSDESTVIRLFEELAEMDNAADWMKLEQYRYFMLKTGIFHILYAAKGTPYRELLMYRDEIFSWLNGHMDGIERNELISWNKPDGERDGVKRAVCIYMLLRRLHLDGMFLRVFRLIGK